MNVPGVGVATVVAEQGRVLLVLRARAPARDLWAFPGGRLELGERLCDGARREVQEECGLNVRVTGLLDAIDAMESCDGELSHWVLVVFLAQYVDGRLTPGDDARDARWVTLDELALLPTAPRVVDLASRAVERWRSEDH